MQYNITPPNWHIENFRTPSAFIDNSSTFQNDIQRRRGIKTVTLFVAIEIAPKRPWKIRWWCLQSTWPGLKIKMKEQLQQLCLHQEPTTPWPLGQVFLISLCCNIILPFFLFGSCSLYIQKHQSLLVGNLTLLVILALPELVVNLVFASFLVDEASGEVVDNPPSSKRSWSSRFPGEATQKTTSVGPKPTRSMRFLPFKWTKHIFGPDLRALIFARK